MGCPEYGEGVLLRAMNQASTPSWKSDRTAIASRQPKSNEGPVSIFSQLLLLPIDLISGVLVFLLCTLGASKFGQCEGGSDAGKLNRLPRTPPARGPPGKLRTDKQAYRSPILAPQDQKRVT